MASAAPRAVLMTTGSDFGWTAIGAALGAVFTGFFAWLTQRSKGGTDVEVAVLAEWQKLNAALSSRVSALETELASVRREHASEIENTRRAHSVEMDKIRKEHRAEMAALRELNEGLQRQIAQNSQSTAALLGGRLVTKPKDGSNGK